jgi:hypothetical protein
MERTLGRFLPRKPDAEQEHRLAQRWLDRRTLHRGAENLPERS